MIKNVSQTIETTVFEDDGALSFAVGPTESHFFEGILYLTFQSGPSPRPSLRIKVYGPADADIRWSTADNDRLSGAQGVKANGGFVKVSSAQGALLRQVISGTVHSGLDIGLVRFAYALDPDAALSADVEAGSFLNVSEII